MRTVVAVLMMLGAATVAVLGVEETPCIPCLQGVSANNLQGKSVVGEDAEDILYQVETQEAMDWQCIIVDIIIGDCIDWDSDPCPSCYYPCIVGCGLVCEAAIAAGCVYYFASTGIIPPWCKYLGVGCIVGCDVICNEACPQCQYCVEHEIIIIKSCGWVFTE